MAIHIKPENRGKFTRKAKAHGEGVQQYAREVLAPGSHASGKTKQEANFARNAAHWNHGGRIGRKKGTLRARLQGHHHHPEHRKV